MTAGRLGIVADDLTGALDSAAPFAASGYSVYVPLNPSEPGAFAHDVVSITTESRALPPDDAAEAVRRVVRRLSSDGRWVYKKIDSLLRGNVGPEAAAAAETCGAEVVLAAPAFPAQGRTVVGGRVYVHGRDLADALRDADPLVGGGAGSVQAAFAGLQEAVLIPLAEVRRGPEAVLGRLNQLSGAVAVADAERDEDMAVLARAVLSCVPRVMPCGSAGLATALASEMGRNYSACAEAAPWSRGVVRPVLVVVGSQSAVSADQVSRLRRRAGVAVVELRAAELDSAGARSAAGELAAALGRGGMVVLLLTGVRELVDAAREAGTEAALTAHIAKRMGEIAALALERQPAGALVLTGGATAMGVLGALGCVGLEVLGEAASGVPVSRAVGGLADGVWVVTKAGAFGGPSLLCDITAMLGGADG